MVDQYNNYSFSQSPTTRLQEFLTIEKPFLNPLPSQSYGIKYFKRLKVQKMGFVYLSDDKHYYSVPYKHIGQYVEVSFNQSIIEIFSNRQRIAIHKRDYRPGKYTALEDHLSSHHKAYSNWSLDYFQYKASKIGPSVQEYITRLILHYAYPELGYKQALGIIMFTKQYSPEQIDKACKKAMPYPSCSFYIIENILKNKLENEPDLFTEQSTHISPHENLRGPQAYS